MKTLKYIFLATTVFALLITAGCEQAGDSSGGGQPEKKPPVSDDAKKPSPQPKADEKKEMTVRLYYPDENGTELVASETKITATDSEKYKAAIEALVKSPDGKAQTTVIPRRTKINDVTVKDGVARVDFSGELIKNFVGGSTGEEMLIGSVVNTLTEFDDVKSVEFFVDGKKVSTLAGHIDLTAPISRMENLLP